ncbi:MAG: DUF1614 domain-containing protein [Gammaproteobacteria bacterium]|nr:DUF1614 domain-containing protein [Gammaproteobacteria bacterium]
MGASLLCTCRRSAAQPPMASIGGAGTFGGIFINGLVAVLLA